MFYYYRSHKKMIFSKFKIDNLTKIAPEYLKLKENKYIYYLQKRDWQNTSPLAALIHSEQIRGKKQEINILRKPEDAGQGFNDFPDWVVKKIEKREVGLCNCEHPRWKERLEWTPPEQWNISIVGLGRVGGTMLIALRSMGGEIIKQIGIFDTNEKSLSRWEQEANQIIDGSREKRYPPVKILKSEEIFQADLAIFCVSMRASGVEQGIKDIRKFQLEANSRIINYYAQRARKNSFNGIFVVLSEPADLLCNSALLASNINNEGKLDGKGLTADQIRGFGLGIMHGRTVYYAEQERELEHYLDKGRVFGSQGPGLVVADSIEHYNREKSSYLTEKVLQANFELAKLGFRPYIASAVASGALSLLNLMEGKWHYSAGFLGEIFWGGRNRQTPVGLEWEQFSFPAELWKDLNNSYQNLKKQAKNDYHFHSEHLPEQ